MTNPVGLHLVWANTGGVTDPTDVKYQTGWIAEIPTFQNFNYVLQGLDKAKLSYAESDAYPWQDFIVYQAGARVRAGNKVHTCITTHNDSAGSNPQDPVADVTNSYWVTGTVYSNKANAFTSLLPKEGFKLDDVNTRTSNNLWESNDITIVNKNCLFALNVESASYDNLVFGNVRGELVVYNAANVTDPDGSDLAADAHKIYHEGNKPTQSDVSGTIPDAPADGKSYVRNNTNWVENTSIDEINPMTVSGEAESGGIINQLQDSGSFTVPAAGSVDVNTIMYIELPDLHKNRTPSVTAFGGDLFRDSRGTDTVLNFIGSALVELVSDGVSEWVVFERAKNGLDGQPASSKVIPYTINGTVIAGGIINQLRDSGTFSLPAASSVEADTILVVELPDKYKAQTPTLLRNGTDFIEDGNGTDTSISWVGAAKFTLTSNGVDTWSL